MKSIKERFEEIRLRVEKAAKRAGRDPGEIRLIAVSKTKPVSMIREAVAAGVTDLGENYIQEAREKIPQIAGDVHWHFIGHLQTNKAKYAARLFDWIHTIDRKEIADALNRRAGMEERVLKVLIEVNVGKEATKSGVMEEDLLPLVEHVATLPNLSLRGLMVIPPLALDPEEARGYFIRTRHLAEQVAARDIPGVSMAELSMGMTADFEVAIEEGATMIRVGTAIFGPREIA
ncbi:MAG: YggS family pyridoxal phosphate-dependent enzyme [Deltaproteobacteria bacterium]|nr:MAG: YggS family pyridoxal phosphate-dependent enzyme [Deltaproteobacteria bacterium]